MQFYHMIRNRCHNRTVYVLSGAWVLSLLLLILPALVSAQISPGDLAEPHAHLEGISHCTDCHILGEKVAAEKCLDCHKLLAQRIDQGKGFHVSEEVKRKECVECHNDHHGRKFTLVRFDTSAFDHSLAGYKLEGKHTETACAACHKAKHITNTEIKKKNFTYLGLGTQCITCHTDVHEGRLNNDCATCHSFKHFKPADKFAHDRARFKLEGKHTDVACEKCHPLLDESNPKSVRKFRDIAFSTCTDCHKDIHEGQFGTNCTECHSTLSFKTLNQGVKFDHNKTRYPLRGKHSRVACTQCHKNGYSAPLPHSRCTNCHSDYHKGEFKLNGKVRDCSECHTVESFQASSYTPEQHNQSSFALRGGHMATPCFECHKKEERWKFRSIGKVCADCHDNIHKDHLKPAFLGSEGCKNCHNEESWAKVNFRHDTTDYPLTGRHQSVSCRACHFKPDSQGSYTQHFDGLSQSCSECHQDPHFGQFATEAGTVCSTCHETNDFKPASLFDHQKTKMPLTGVHANLKCADCHKTLKTDPETNKSYVYYKIDPRCENCHK